jgi:hypothetical protein
MAKKSTCSYCNGNGFINYGLHIREVPSLGDQKTRKAWEGVLGRAYQCPWCGKPDGLREMPEEMKPKSAKAK